MGVITSIYVVVQSVLLLALMALMLLLGPLLSPSKILTDAFRGIEVLSIGLKLVKVANEICFYLRGKSLT